MPESSAPKTDNVTVTLPNTIIGGGVGAFLKRIFDMPLLNFKFRQQDPNIPYTKLGWNFKEHYKGFTGNLSIIPTTIFQLSSKRVLEEYFHDPLAERTSDHVKISAAAGAGLLGAILSNPIELISGRLHKKSEQHLGFAGIAQSIWKKEGLSGLQRGLPLTIYRDITFMIFCFHGTDKLREYFSKYFSEPTSMVLGGTIAGTTAAYVSHAFDTVKTRQQTLSTEFYPKGFFPSFSVIKYILKNEGCTALLKGAPYRAGCIALSGIFIANGPRVAAEISENLSKRPKSKHSPWSYPWS